MAKARTKAAATADDDLDRLERQAAGTYRTADDRFEVRQADASWFVVDRERANDFGQELIHGPYPTLTAARATLATHRSGRGPQPRKPMRSRGRAGSRNRAAEQPPAPPPRSWIDELPKRDATEVRRLIAALEAEGIPDAEAVVRRDRDGLLPAIATRRLEERLASMIGDLPEGAQDAAREIVRRVADAMASGGGSDGPLPGWALVEVEAGGEAAGRRIDLRR